MQKAGVNSLTFLGDAMGRPVAQAILAEPDRWDLSSLVAVSNGAAPLSEGVRAEIRKALPDRFILDSYGASESGATGSRVDDGTEGALGAPKFGVGDDVEVFDSDFKPAAPGVEGMLGRSGPIPLGYYKDEEKTAATFKEIEGKRWSIPGDFARREDDGSVTVLGRGSVCINTGGEKVHPEEVEAVLLRHDDVFDAAVVGTDHERWGQQVTALVQRREGSDVTEDDLRDFVRSLLANYKVPKQVLFVPQVPRTPVSKVDYPANSALARELLGAGSERDANPWRSAGPGRVSDYERVGLVRGRSRTWCSCSTLPFQGRGRGSNPHVRSMSDDPQPRCHGRRRPHQRRESNTLRSCS